VEHKPESRYKKGCPERKQKKTRKGAITKEFFPSAESRLAVNLKFKPKRNNNYDRPWKY